MLENSDKTGRRKTVSPRELDVLRLVAEGKSNVEIAGELGIVFNTVTTYMSRLGRKTDFGGNRYLLTKWYLEKFLPYDLAGGYQHPGEKLEAWRVEAEAVWAKLTEPGALTPEHLALIELAGNADHARKEYAWFARELERRFSESGDESDRLKADYIRRLLADIYKFFGKRGKRSHLIVMMHLVRRDRVR